MRRRGIPVFLALLALGVLPASAGEDFRCSNGCPLAQQANGLRAYGDEAVTVSAVLKEDVARAVCGNLDRV
jgi:hypothetical protein